VIFASRLLLSVAPLVLAGCPGPNPVLADGGGDLQLVGDSLTCTPNNNGQIDLSKLNFKVGLAATYRVNPPGTLVDVDVEGKLVGGTTEWDFSATDGTVMTLAVEPPTGAWYSTHFPTASFAIAADAAGNTLQLFRQESDRLLLLGIASRKADQTLMVYDTPILSFRFPLKVGDSHTATSTVTNGKLNGLPIATEDSYEVKVDRAGAVRLPYLRLTSALRIQIRVTSSALGGAKASYRQYQWFQECYGEVARIASQKDEPSASFGKAVEFRRLTF
jgi:hypothetical protein